MRYSEVFETFQYNDKVIDLRGKVPKGSYNKTPIVFAVLNKEGGAYTFNYGESDINGISWRDTHNFINDNMDTRYQEDILDICIVSGGILISGTANDGGFGQARSSYSDYVKTLCRELLNRKVVLPTSKVFLGNWANNKYREYIGTINKVANGKELPDKLILYHGTSSYRLAHILKDGIRPVERDMRIWRGTRRDPIKDRGDNNGAVYLTPSKIRAGYYANQAVGIDKKTFSPKKLRDMSYHLNDMKNNKAHFEKLLSKETDQSEKEYLQDILDGIIEMIDKTEKTLPADFDGDMKPVILKVVIPRKNFKYFYPDDDYMRLNKREYTQDDWILSLKDFGQVAYRGEIRPDDITVV